MTDEKNITVALVLPVSIVKWLDAHAIKADTNRSQVARTKLRQIKTMEENSPMLAKAGKTKDK